MFMPAFLEGGFFKFYPTATPNTPADFGPQSWLADYRIALAAAFETEGLGRQLIASRIQEDPSSGDKYILTLRVGWPDGRSASVKTRIWVSAFNPAGSFWEIAGIGGTAASQP